MKIAILKPNNIKVGNAFWYGQHPIFMHLKKYGFQFTYITYDQKLKSNELFEIKAYKKSIIKKVYTKIFRQSDKIYWIGKGNLDLSVFDIIITEGIDYDYCDVLSNFSGKIIINESISVEKSHSKRQVNLYEQKNVSFVFVNPVAKALSLNLFPNLQNYVIGHALNKLEKMPYPVNRKNFLVVGRLSEEKGIDTIIKAYSLLNEHTKQSHRLVICGTGKLERRLQYLVKKLKLVSQVDFSGHLDQSEINKLMQTSVALVSHPRSTSKIKEAFGMIYLEALHFDLPCIATNLDTLREIYGHRLQYVQEGSINQMVKAMELVASGVVERQVNEHIDFLENYSVNRIADQWCKVLLDD